ncbi:MAG: hypothetical protein J3Q66DRAFT_374825 [Benniella sp.]|nr:MAG: hypothetical protein J3Q66DRAFT_374825 [Benniella sp.]
MREECADCCNLTEQATINRTTGSRSLEPASSLSLLPDTTVNYILALGEALEQRADVVAIPLPTFDTEACEIARMTFMVWQRLYRKTAFLAELLEAYWARKA